MTAPVNPEGQTAREVHAKGCAFLTSSPLSGDEGALCNCGKDQRDFEKWSAAQEVRRAALEEAARLVESMGDCAACDHAEEIRALASTPSPAKQTEQKIASAEGTASQLGAAPATLCTERIDQCAFVAGHDGPCLNAKQKARQDAGFCPWVYAEADRETPCSLPLQHEGDHDFPPEDAAAAQPDARDAEIARLREERDFERGQRDLRHAAYIEERDKAARLTNELEEARAQSRMDEKLATDALAGHVAGKLRADAAEAETKALREALEAAVATAKKWHDSWSEKDRHKAIRLRVEAGEETREFLAALHPPEPKAETPAETAGQKEGP